VLASIRHAHDNHRRLCPSVPLGHAVPVLASGASSGFSIAIHDHNGILHCSEQSRAGKKPTARLSGKAAQLVAAAAQIREGPETLTELSPYSEVFSATLRDHLVRVLD
jgi:hypothetical protein